MSTPDNSIISPRGILPEPTLRRLPWYLAYVSLARSNGVEYISTTTLAKDLSVDASQIAKDLSFLDIRGKTRIGYEVAQLDDTLREFLGFNHPHNAVMVGVGSLGAALIADRGLANFGLDIVAGFDIRRELIGTSINGVPIHDISQLAEERARLNAEIGIVAVPFACAQEVADTMIAAGIKALWNFTPFRIRTSAGIVVANTSIYSHLAVMYNRLGILDSTSNDFL